MAGVARALCHGPPLQAEDVEHQHTHPQKDGEGREEESERKEGKGRGWRRTHPLPWATTPGRGHGAPAHAPPEGRRGKGGKDGGETEENMDILCAFRYRPKKHLGPKMISSIRGSKK